MARGEGERGREAEEEGERGCEAISFWPYSNNCTNKFSLLYYWLHFYYFFFFLYIIKTFLQWAREPRVFVFVTFKQYFSLINKQSVAPPQTACLPAVEGFPELKEAQIIVLNIWTHLWLNILVVAGENKKKKKKDFQEIARGSCCRLYLFFVMHLFFVCSLYF